MGHIPAFNQRSKWCRSKLGERPWQKHNAKYLDVKINGECFYGMVTVVNTATG
jgi:hypothetical protein